jgi:hypothetical protein
MDINELSQLPEHLYITILMEIVPQLPEAVRKPIGVRDASAFNSFLRDSKNSLFKKYLVLRSLNDAINFEQQQSYRGQQYVSSKPPRQAHPIFTVTQAPPIARLLTQPGVPMYIVTMCCDLFLALLTIQIDDEEQMEPTLKELCNVAALPASILSFIERVCDDPAAQNNVKAPSTFVWDYMKLFCSIVIEACRIGKFQDAASSQALLPSCLRLLKRFKPLVEANSLAAGGQPIKLPTPFVLDLLCATSCLLYSSVHIPQDACCHFLTDLLRYIDIESDKSTKFALLCCLGPTLAKLCAPQAAVASAPGASAALDSADSAQLQNDDHQQATIRALIKLLSQARRYPLPPLPPPTLSPPSSPTQASSGELSARISLPCARKLTGRFAAVAKSSNTIFGVALQIVSDFVDSAGMAAFCVSEANSALLTIVCKQLEKSAGEAEARPSVCFCETLIQLLCDINIREKIPDDSAPKSPHPDACLLVAPIWDALLDAADVTPAADVCFAILRSLLNLITAVHPALLENMFIAVIPPPAPSSGRSPRAFVSPAASESSATPRSNADSLSPPLSPASRLAASFRAERLFKLLAQVARKFSRSKIVQQFARTVLDALLTLLKTLPTARPLARLCHRHRLVDLSSELVGMRDEHRSSGDYLDVVVAELRSILESHMAPPSDRSQIINELEAIAHALAVAVVGSAALPHPAEPVITAHDALNFLCDSAKVSVHFNSCQHITLLFNFVYPHISLHHHRSPPTWKIWTRLKFSRSFALLPLSKVSMLCRSLSVCAGHQSAVLLHE